MPEKVPNVRARVAVGVGRAVIVGNRNIFGQGAADCRIGQAHIDQTGAGLEVFVRVSRLGVDQAQPVRPSFRYVEGATAGAEIGAAPRDELSDLVINISNVLGPVEAPSRKPSRHDKRVRAAKCTSHD